MTQTALGATALTSAHRHPRHLVGSALRAVAVFVDTAFRVAVLGPESYRELADRPPPGLRAYAPSSASSSSASTIR